MRQIEIKIQVDNEAFNSDQIGDEVARILREYAVLAENMQGNLWRGFKDESLYIYKNDINGNKVARLSFEWD